jgi:coenzyme F420 hydrogenase subunit beta
MIKVNGVGEQVEQVGASAEPLFRQAIDRIVAADNCTGCGLCAALSDQVEMRLNDDGYLRPVWVDGEPDDDPDGESLRRFKAGCPGVAVHAPQVPGARSHPIMGPYISVWTGWAKDPDARHAGSSAGVLTSLAAWLIESGRAPSVIGAGPSPDRPRRTVPVTITSKQDALAAAGSRYAPVAVASLFDDAAARSGAALVGKPCEAYAVRRSVGSGPLADAGPAPFIMSFFCAGVPSQRATDDLVTRLAEGREVSSVRYRGNGWPGNFAVRTTDGQLAEVDYEESWGKALGPHVQNRCKICPDGVGEHADIAVGDFWLSDDKGYPVFSDAEPVSAVIARTRRGHETLMAAAEAGIVELRPADLDDVAKVQPLQVQRRRTLLPRLLGRLLAGRRIPAQRGYHLLATEVATADSMWGFLTEFVAVVRGSRSRARRMGPGKPGRELDHAH